MAQPVEPTFLKETVAIGIVLGASVFGMIWGGVNTLLVSIMIPEFEINSIIGKKS